MGLLGGEWGNEKENESYHSRVLGSGPGLEKDNENTMFLRVLGISLRTIQGFPKKRGTLVGLPIIRTTCSILGSMLYLGPPIQGNYQIGTTIHSSFHYYSPARDWGLRKGPPNCNKPSMSCTEVFTSILNPRP